MKKAVFLMPLVVICMLAACSKSSESSNSVNDNKDKTLSQKQEQINEPECSVISVNADIISFDNDILSIDNNGTRLDFDTVPYYEKGGNREVDTSIINNSFNIKIKAKLSYYDDNNELIKLDVITPNGKQMTGDYTIKSITDNIAILDNNGATYTVDVHTLAENGYGVFDNKRLKGEYGVTGICFYDSNNCVVSDILPKISEKNGTNHYSIKESDIIPKYICAQVKSKDGAVVTATRNDNGQDVVFTAAMYSDGVSFNNDEHIFYALLSGNDADEKTSEHTMCVILPAGDITGEIIYTSTQDKTPAIYISYNGEQIKLETQTIIDKNGKQIDINDLKSGMSVTVNADDIRYMGSVYDKCYYVNSVRVE